MTTPATPAQQAGGLQDIIERMSDRQAKARHTIMTVMTAGRELLKEGSVLESGQQSELQTKIFTEHLNVTDQCIRDGLDEEQLGEAAKLISAINKQVHLGQCSEQTIQVLLKSPVITPARTGGRHAAGSAPGRSQTSCESTFFSLRRATAEVWHAWQDVAGRHLAVAEPPTQPDCTHRGGGLHIPPHCSRSRPYRPSHGRPGNWGAFCAVAADSSWRASASARSRGAIAD